MLPTSLVTPSLNQAAFLEEALASVLDQRYPELEYIVADGGSTDGSVEILERHAPRLAAWWSGPDDGHADAVNHGFAQSSGEIMGWLNADDRLLPGSLQIVAEIFERFPDVQWLTSGFPVLLNARGQAVLVNRVEGFHRELFRRGLVGDLYPWSRFPFVQQESTFWRRGLWEAAGGRLDESYEPAADFELWTRFFEHAELYTVDTLIGAFRAHPAQRTASQMDSYRREARRALGRHGEPRRPRLSSRAANLLPPRLRSRAPWAVQAPCIRWSRKAESWVASRRVVA